MWTLALHDEVPDRDFLGPILLGAGSALRLVFGPSDAFDRQALEEVVEELVELPFAPRDEATAQEQRIRPVDALIPDNEFE